MNMITVPQFYLILVGWLRAVSYTAQHDSQYTKNNCHNDYSSVLYDNHVNKFQYKCDWPPLYLFHREYI